MALPLPPQIGQPSPGPQGPIQSYNPQSMQTQQFQMQGMQNLGQGIGQLISGLRMREKKQKEEAWQNAVRDITLLSQGMPVDQQSIAKNLHKAGIKLDVNSPTPQEVEAQRVREQQAQNIQAFQASPMGMGMGQDEAVKALLAPQARQAPTSPAPNQPGAFKRAIGGIGDLLGLKGGQPAPSPGAPIYHFLQQLENQGKLSQSTAMASQQQKFQMMQMMTTAVDDLLKGNTNSPAVMMLERTGALKGPEGVAGVLRIAEMSGQDTKQASQAIFDHYLGGPQLRAKMMDIYADLVGQNSEMQFKISDQALKLMGDHENLDYGLAFQLSTAFNSGDKQMQQAAMDITRGLTTKGQADKKQRDFENNLKTKQDTREDKKLGFEQQRIGQEGQRIGLARQQLQQGERRLEMDVLQAKNAVMKEIASFDKQAFDAFAKMMTNPKATTEEKQAAVVGLSDATQRMGTRELEMPGGGKISYNFTKLKPEDISTFGGLFGSEWIASPMAAPDNIPGTGQPPQQGGTPFSEMLNIIMQQAPSNQWQQMLMRQKPAQKEPPPKVDASQYNRFKVTQPTTPTSFEEQLRMFVGR